MFLGELEHVWKEYSKPMQNPSLIHTRHTPGPDTLEAQLSI